MRASNQRRNSGALFGAPLLALAVACMGGCVEGQSTQEHETILPVPPRAESDFKGPDDLLQAVENGTFAKRVNLDQQLDQMIVPASIDVEFVKGTQVPDGEVERLEKLATPFRSNEKLQVSIVGCSDRKGDKDVNLRVSKARAESVAARLEKLGVQRSQIIDVVGKGEACKFPARVVHVIPSVKGVKQAKLIDIAEGAVKEVD
jgi:outer membrane protein OmpA-like peptidoglycan-associated protein